MRAFLFVTCLVILASSSPIDDGSTCAAQDQCFHNGECKDLGSFMDGCHELLCSTSTENGVTTYSTSITEAKCSNGDQCISNGDTFMASYAQYPDYCFEMLCTITSFPNGTYHASSSMVGYTQGACS